MDAIYTSSLHISPYNTGHENVQTGMRIWIGIYAVNNLQWINKPLFYGENNVWSMYIHMYMEIAESDAMLSGMEWS